MAKKPQVRTFAVPDLGITVEVVNQGAKRDRDGTRDWYRVKVQNLNQRGARYMGRWGSSLEDRKARRDISMDLAAQIVNELGRAAADPDLYMQQEGEGASPAQMRRLEDYVGVAQSLGDEIVWAHEALEGDPHNRALVETTAWATSRRR